MDRRVTWHDGLCLAVALAPACLIAWWWPGWPVADLPFVVAPMYAMYRLATALDGRLRTAFGWGTLFGLTCWWAAERVQPGQARWLLLLAAAQVAGVAWVAIRSPWGDRRRCGWAALRAAVLSSALLLGAGALLSVGPGATTGGATAARPGLFIPLQLDPAGRQMLLFSLRDLDDDQDETFSLWNLDAHSGRPQRVFRGYPYLLADWCPAGRSVAFLDADASWDEQEVPFAVRLAKADGSASRRLLEPPTGGASWMYPLWSRRDNLIGAWRLPGDGGDMIRSVIVPADGGQPRPLQVPGCRLALLGAWQADGPGAYAITERGLFLVGPGGKPRRLVPAGEAPVEPFPFITPDGVSPTGRHVAYLQLHFSRGTIAAMDLGLVDLEGRRRKVLDDVYPVAFGWSRDGTLLAAAKVDRQERIAVLLTEMPSGRRKWLATGLKLASREYPMRLQPSPDGRFVTIEGMLRDEENWDVAVVDVAQGKTTWRDNLRNHLVTGWRDDGRVVVSTLSEVGTAAADGSDYQPIYGQAANVGVTRRWQLAQTARRQTLRWLEPARRAAAAAQGLAPAGD